MCLFSCEYASRNPERLSGKCGGEMRELGTRGGRVRRPGSLFTLHVFCFRKQQEVLSVQKVKLKNKTRNGKCCTSMNV